MTTVWIVTSSTPLPNANTDPVGFTTRRGAVEYITATAGIGRVNWMDSNTCCIHIKHFYTITEIVLDQK
jgi:hypothetical protein